MSRLILHAGMNKTGSTSIQSWLSENADILSVEHGLFVLRAEVDESGTGCHLKPVEKGEGCASNPYMRAYQMHGARKRQKLINDLVAQLHENLDCGMDVIITSEAFHSALIDDGAFINALEEIACKHDVCINYYVRPQHTALEAGWCQWGFRGTRHPERFLINYKKVLYYYEDFRQLKKTAPNVRFYIRPYRRDLMEGHNVIIDFINHGLRLPDRDFIHEETWLNASLPLNVVNILRQIPSELLWTTAHDNSQLVKLKEILDFSKFNNDEKIMRSRDILQNYCYEEFEEDNKKLIKELEWNCTNFVEPLQNGNEVTTELKEINKLWRARIGKDDLEFIIQLLAYIFKQQ